MSRVKNISTTERVVSGLCGSVEVDERKDGRFIRKKFEGVKVVAEGVCVGRQTRRPGCCEVILLHGQR